MQKNHHKTKGALLIELMVAFTLISVALLSAAKLHSVIMGTRSDAKQRLLALKRLSQKTDDLKQFEVLQTETGKMAFQDIGNNTGGSIPAGTNQGFTLTWCVDTDDCQGTPFHGNYYYHGYNAAPTTTVAAGTTIPNFKKIKIIITWNNNQGIQKQISNEIIINARDIKKSGIVTNATINLA